MPPQAGEESVFFQPGVYGPQAGGLLRVAAAHVVQQAVRMAQVRYRHIAILPPSRYRLKTSPWRCSISPKTCAAS